jgi:hypothetical protein
MKRVNMKIQKKKQITKIQNLPRKVLRNEKLLRQISVSINIIETFP